MFGLICIFRLHNYSFNLQTMKKTIYAFAVLSSLFLVACGGDKSSDASGEKTEQSGNEMNAGPTLIGEWQLSDMDMGMEIPEESKPMFDALVEEMKANSTMTFKEDGTYISRQAAMGEVTNEKGKYKLDGNKIETTSENGKTEKLDIDLGKDSFTISVMNRGQKMTMTYTRK